jgi:tetratricopeptide (TPR) repeat protein/uncharacterized membrane protein YqjE
MKLKLFLSSTICVFAFCSWVDAQGVITIQRNSRPITIPAGSPVRGATMTVFEEGVASAQVANTVAASPANASPDDAQRKQDEQKRLQELSQIDFNRLPSNILETWSQSGTVNEDHGEDLPPAPPQAFLKSTQRFKIATDKLRRDFTIGNWQSVGKFLSLLPVANAKAVYSSMIRAATGANDWKLQGAQSGSRFDPRQLQSLYMSFEDLLDLAQIAPQGIDKTHVSLFGAAFRKTISQGNEPDELIELFRLELAKKKPVFTKRQIAKILFQAGLTIPALEFLPELETAKKENDHEALNLLSRHYLAVHQKEEKIEDLEQAWHVTQAILTASDVDAGERKQALARAVQLSTQVSDELGQKWLHDSFVARPETGREVLGAIGADVAKSMKSSGSSAASRLARLTLQNDAVNALLSVSSEQANHWREQLNLLAQNWLREAVVSYSDDRSTTLGPSMRRDRFGNIFYYDDQEMANRPYTGRLQPIAKKDLLKLVPCPEWMELIDDTLKPKFESIQAQLYLKVGEDDLALPFIERLAKSRPDTAKQLVDEFVRVWTRNHDPNSDRRRTNVYMYMYGFESRAESIPLTRSKQERNLKELAELVKRLRPLVDEDLNESLLAQAFFVCHSTAEVYRIKSIEDVFGPVQDMNPKTLATITSKMRSNLATLWRDANVQKDKKTKRRKKDIEAEVINGYQTATRIIEGALEKNPDEWKLVQIRAALLHDENNYRAELANDSQFTPRRQQSLKMFQQAAKMYSEGVDQLEENDYTTLPFETWFYACMGACDLQLITDKHRSDPKQPALIREALESLPPDARQWHLDRFANLLFNRMSSVGPSLKFKYLDRGFEIVGDNEQAEEARKVHDYYKDLVTEIKLEAAIDGSDRVGSQSPFGVLVTLRHTKQIERESGGFGRYLQNQNSNRYFSYNYGRPTEDYRDKFDEFVRETFAEQFEVMSITFQEPDVKSIPLAEDGWRVTPYAYVLLKAKGPEVDKVPPFKLDLDFLDTSGYAILPVESPVIPIDASETSKEPRPFNHLTVTQILDERQADDGKLILEIKATAQGLVPDLENFLEIDPGEFEVVSIDDEGVSVSQFDKDETEPTVLCDRNWIVSFQAKPGLMEKPGRFAFPQPGFELQEVSYQRYVDADLATVEPVINLEEDYAETNYGLIAGMVALGLMALVMLTVLLIWAFNRLRKPGQESKVVVPQELSPFAAISLLQDIHANNGLSEKKKAELKQAIDRLEQHYFGEHPNRESPDLNSEVTKWTRQSRFASSR